MHVRLEWSAFHPTSPDPFQIFSTEREARDWLNTNPLLRNKVDPPCADVAHEAPKRSAS